MSAAAAVGGPPPKAPEWDVKEGQERAEIRRLLQGKKVMVLAGNPSGGLGDAMTARKICLYISEHFGVATANLTLASAAYGDDPGATYDLLISDKMKLKSNEFSTVESLDPDVQIFFPDEYTARPYIALDNTVPTLCLGECGHPPPKALESNTVHVAALGLSDDSMGYVPDPQLRAWAAQKGSLTPTQKLEKLETIPEVIQRAILGEAYSKPAIESFAKSSKLYFGYANDVKEISHFIEGIVKMHHELKTGSEFCFYMMGNTITLPFIPEGCSADYRDMLLKKLPNLKGLGIGGIDFVCAKTGQIDKFECDPASSKRIKVIVGSLDPQHVRAMHMASEEETLTTGDQSFCEALSAEKIPIYEILNHKENFYRQFLAAAKELAIDLHDGSSKIDPDKVKNFLIGLRKDPAKLELVKKVMKRIAAQYEFDKQFDKALHKVLSTTVKKTKLQRIDNFDLDKITSDDIPLDTPFLISKVAMSALKISGETGESDLTNKYESYVFKGSTFRYKMMYDGYCIVRSQKQGK